MTRREAAEKIFDHIKENKFMPINIEYGDSYFIFDHGEDGVVHFNIKGLRHWKFGMWINTTAEELKNDDGEDYPAVQFFCRHTLDLDKFKPSRSFFRVNIGLKEIEEDEPWEFYEIKHMLQMIKRHPLVAFSMSWIESNYCDESYLGFYLKRVFREAKYKVREWWKDTRVRIWHGPKVWFIKKYKVVDSVELIDGNSDGWKTYPRYDMRIHFKKISDDEQKQNEAELKMLNVFFRKNYYSNMHLSLTRDGVEGFYSYTKR